MSDAPTETPADAGGQGAGEASWTAAIPEDLTYEVKGDDGKPATIKLREHKKLAEFKDVGSLAKSYVEAQKLIGEKAGIKPLPKNATDEEKAEWEQGVRELIGVPKAAKDYILTVDEGTAADDPVVAAYRELGHKYGLSNSQLQGVYSDFMAFSKDYWAKEAERMGEEATANKETELKAAQEAVKKVWGDKAKENTEIAKRGFQAVAKKAEIPEADTQAFLDKHGNDLSMLKIFKAIGDTYLEDSGAHDTAGGTSGDSAAEKLRRQYPKMPPEAFKQKS